MTAQLWIPGPLPGMNEMIDSAKGAGGVGKHYARLKRAWTDTVWALAKQARLPSFSAADLVFEWRERNRRRDLDNICAAKKLVLDGLVKARVLPGDGWGFVRGFSDRFVTAGLPGVLVTISDDSATVTMGGT